LQATYAVVEISGKLPAVKKFSDGFCQGSITQNLKEEADWLSIFDLALQP